MAKAWRTRRYFRVSHDSPLTLRVHREHRKTVRLVQKDIAGKLLDLSEGGCGVETTLFIPRGTKVNLFLGRGLLDTEGEPGNQKGYTRITALIVSCILRGVRQYRLGLQFVKISKKDLDLISRFVKFHERRKEPRGDA